MPAPLKTVQPTYGWAKIVTTKKKKQSKPGMDGYILRKQNEQSNFPFWVTWCVLPNVP
jgi:hypothetical protein